MRWAVRLSFGRGKGSKAVPMEVLVVLSESLTVTPGVAIGLLSPGVCGGAKWSVAPESAMPCVTG